MATTLPSDGGNPSDSKDGHGRHSSLASPSLEPVRFYQSPVLTVLSSQEYSNEFMFHLQLQIDEELIRHMRQERLRDDQIIALILT